MIELSRAMGEVHPDLQTILDSSNNAFIAVNREGRIIFCNTQVERILETSAEHVLGKPVEDYFPMTGLLRVLKTGQPELAQKVTINGVVYLSNRSPVFDNGQVVAAVAVFQDITELQSVIDELADDNRKIRELKKTLETVLNLAYEGLIVVNKDGVVTMTNQAFASFLNRSPESMIGKHVTEVYENPKFPEVLKTGKPVFGYIHDLNGHEIVASRVPIIEDGIVVGAIGKVIFRDVNELYALAEKVNSLRSEVAYYKDELRRFRKYDFGLDEIVGNSEKFQGLKEIARRVAHSNSTVLIRGESGTGKELFAHALHAESPRKNGPFIKVNCAAVPENLLESELFGYQEGAFTGARKGGQIGKFQLADKGTIFLDEIGDMPLRMQAKLLRVLQEKEIERLGDSKPVKVDVRVVTATNQNLEDLIRKKEFREDLYYRLNVVTLNIPPLRERMEDLPILVDHFIKKFNEQFGKRVSGVSPDVRALLMKHQWPGNVRELENVIERAFNVLDDKQIQFKHLPLYLQKMKATRASHAASQTLQSLVESVEREAIIDALAAAKGNKVQAAALLGLSRAGLYKKLAKYNLDGE
ncbi:MAG: sigma 54-interacting transcriptional regulator [Syntrophothermus sp.]